MFEKLFLLVKSNAENAVFNNPGIPAMRREAVINEASSSIIEELKAQLESGRVKDLIKYFRFADSRDGIVVNSIVKRFANKLNNSYKLDNRAAIATAAALIKPVMQQVVSFSRDGLHADFTVQNLLSKISGGVDHSILINSYMVA